MAHPSKRSPHHPEVLGLCESAENCETYDTPQGLMIRFKAGMEPGTEDYNKRFPNTTEHATLMKRNTQSHATFGSTSISYGTTNPCDALHHCLYDYCHEGSCDPSTCTADTQDIYQQGASSGPRSRTLDISSQGQYNGWDERDHYVDAVVAAASKGQQWTQHNWCIRTKEGDDCGTQWWGQQTNFISVNKFYNGNLRGFIQAQVAMDTGSGGWCSSVSGLLGSAGAIAGAINPIAGGFFGFVTGLCS
ncbi:hypothetical protein AOQ84DRAFT_349179 [Glonium stellatum]|uniref:Uncharacterized protein n=1 Tax=Glonium stellatum TaxID=574774 RepID=A0A8E2JMB9_9PEZI|nr:hypothetical protein AOQ84DRAFT_349179 [Glonium stellatum]